MVGYKFSSPIFFCLNLALNSVTFKIIAGSIFSGNKYLDLIVFCNFQRLGKFYNSKLKIFCISLS